MWKARGLTNEKWQTMMSSSLGTHVSKVASVYCLKCFGCSLSWAYVLTVIVIKMDQTVLSV